MKRWCLALLLLLPVWAQAEDALRDIRLVSEVWHDYTNTDGSGLAWDHALRLLNLLKNWLNIRMTDADSGIFRAIAARK